MSSATASLYSRLHIFFVLGLLSVIYSSCVHKYDDDKHKASFKSVIGVNYLEARRRFGNGLSFNKNGYELNPIWKLSFLSEDKASVYSPDKNRFLNFPVVLDHDSLFNIANTWLKALKVTKDSLLIQVLKVEGKTVYFDKSTVYMTFYSDKYIKNVLHKDLEELKKTDKHDTLFIRKRVAEVNANPDSAFAARQPVKIKSRSPLVSVEEEKIEADVMNRFDSSDAYMFPEFTITIDKAYEDFSYSFVASIDTSGQIHFQKSLIYISPEFNKTTIATIKAIIDGYLKAYLQVTPGSTLKMVHNSAITLNVQGRKR